MSMFTKVFWKDTFERAVKSAAQFAVGAFGAGATSLLSVPAMAVLGAAGAGFVLSVLTSLASIGVGGGSASMVKEVQEAPLPDENLDFMPDDGDGLTEAK